MSTDVTKLNGSETLAASAATGGENPFDQLAKAVAEKVAAGGDGGGRKPGRLASNIWAIALAALSAGGSAWVGMKTAIAERPTVEQVKDMIEDRPPHPDLVKVQQKVIQIDERTRGIDDKVNDIRVDLRELRNR